MKSIISIIFALLLCSNTMLLSQGLVRDRYPGLGDVIYYSDSKGMPNGKWTMHESTTSINGGTRVFYLTGNMSHNKKTGLWTGAITYTNYRMSSGIFCTGSEKISINFKDGVLHGKYTFVSNLKYRNGGKNLRGQWVYDAYDKPRFVEISTAFNNGKLNGVYISNRSDPLIYTNIYFRNDTCVGNWDMNLDGAKVKLQFDRNDGFVTYGWDVNQEHWGGEYKYTAAEIAALSDTLEKIKTVRLNDVLFFFQDEINGYTFNKYLKEPHGSSEEYDTIPVYKFWDVDKHTYDIGELPYYEKNMRASARGENYNK